MPRPLPALEDLLRTLALATLIAVVAACDTSGPVVYPSGEEPEGPWAPIAAGEDAGGAAVAVGIWQGTTFFGGQFGSEPHLNLPQSGIWLRGYQDDEDRLAVAGDDYPLYYSQCPGTGTYLLSREVRYAAGTAPPAGGLPLDGEGRPLIYGDDMIWTKLCMAPSPSAFVPLENVEISVASFAYDDLPNVRFARFEIHNTGDVPIEGLRAGFFADYDLSDYYWNNVIGGDDRTSYVYIDPDAFPELDLPRGALAGVTMLETPAGDLLDVRRIVYRVSIGRTPNPLLDQRYDDASNIFNTLDGLYEDGTPIIDPTTGQPTTKMFSGDPVAGTGWLDGDVPGAETGWDLRMLTAGAPADLAAGERTVLTVMLAMINAGSLQASLDVHQLLIRQLATSPQRWRYTVAGG